MPPNLVNVGSQTAENCSRVFAHPTKVCAQDVLHAYICDTFRFSLIIFARWRLWSTQMPRAWLALVRLRAGRAHAGLFHASVFCIYLSLIKFCVFMGS